MKLKRRNYYGFDHDKVNQQFKGNLTYINDFCIDIKGLGYTTCAVYHAATPDKSRGHKEYMLLFSTPMSSFMVTGRTKSELKKESKHNAILCKECDTVLVSLHIHDYHTCGCPNETTIDGGKDYQGYGGKDLTKVEHVVIDLLTNRVGRKKVL